MSRWSLPILLIGTLIGGLALIPWRDPVARRRAWFLALLPTPALTLLLCGPLGLVRKPYGAAQESFLMQIQPWGVALCALVVVILVLALRGLRSATLVLGALAIFAAVAVASVNQLIITPTS